MPAIVWSHTTTKKTCQLAYTYKKVEIFFKHMLAKGVVEIFFKANPKM